MTSYIRVEVSDMLLLACRWLSKKAPSHDNDKLKHIGHLRSLYSKYSFLSYRCRRYS